jgi:hypothetical protein
MAHVRSRSVRRQDCPNDKSPVNISMIRQVMFRGTDADLSYGQSLTNKYTLKCTCLYTFWYLERLRE